MARSTSPPKWARAPHSESNCRWQLDTLGKETRAHETSCSTIADAGPARCLLVFGEPCGFHPVGTDRLRGAKEASHSLADRGAGASGNAGRGHGRRRERGGSGHPAGDSCTDAPGDSTKLTSETTHRDASGFAREPGRKTGSAADCAGTQRARVERAAARNAA